jgi:hypothetical protein
MGALPVNVHAAAHVIQLPDLHPVPYLSEYFTPPAPKSAKAEDDSDKKVPGKESQGSVPPPVA